MKSKGDRKNAKLAKSKGEGGAGEEDGRGANVYPLHPTWTWGQEAGWFFRSGNRAISMSIPTALVHWSKPASWPQVHVGCRGYTFASSAIFLACSTLTLALANFAILCRLLLFMLLPFLLGFVLLPPPPQVSLLRPHQIVFVPPIWPQLLLWCLLIAFWVIQLHPCYSDSPWGCDSVGPRKVKSLLKHLLLMWTYEECIHLFAPFQSIQLWILSGELMRVEYSTVDTLGWAHGQLSIELWTLRWAHEELSIQLWTLSGGLIESWVFNCEHSLVSSWTAEYSTANTLGWAHGTAEYWAADTLRWAHWKFEYSSMNTLGWAHGQLWTLSGGLIESWVFNYGTLIDTWAFQLWTVSSWAYSELSIQLFTPYDQMEQLSIQPGHSTLYKLQHSQLTPDNLRWAINSGY